jgi:hypothetical protein
LRAAFALWQYAEASARLIFTEEEALDPLEKSLLSKITASPGINRKRLHKALGGHVQAEAMVAALGKLAAQGMVRSETVSTSGRPSECWWSVQTPTMPSCISSEIAASPSGDASERTKPQVPEQPQAVPADRQMQQDSSIVRTNPPDGVGATADQTSPMTLLDLFDQVREMGGKIVRSEDGGFAVQGVVTHILSPAILAALAAHRAELDSIVPSPVPPQIVEATPKQPEPHDNQAPVASDTPYRCSRCGAALPSSDAICDPCFVAELESLGRDDGE